MFVFHVPVTSLQALDDLSKICNFPEWCWVSGGMTRPHDLGHMTRYLCAPTFGGAAKLSECFEAAPCLFREFCQPSLLANSSGMHFELVRVFAYGLHQTQQGGGSLDVFFDTANPWSPTGLLLGV